MPKPLDLRDVDSRILNASEIEFGAFTPYQMRDSVTGAPMTIREEFDADYDPSDLPALIELTFPREPSANLAIDLIPSGPTVTSTIGVLMDNGRRVTDADFAGFVPVLELKARDLGSLDAHFASRKESAWIVPGGEYDLAVEMEPDTTLKVEGEIRFSVRPTGDYRDRPPVDAPRVISISWPDWFDGLAIGMSIPVIGYAFAVVAGLVS